MNTFKRRNKTVSLLNYRFVFCQRYRRKIFLNHAVEEFFKKQTKEVCDQLGIDIISMECDVDHVHLFVQSVPTLSPSDIMAKIKGTTSRAIRKEFEHLNHLPSVWTRSYFVSTAGNMSSETIKRYVEEQKTRG